MVSAVFHSSLDTRSAEARAPRVAASLAANEPLAPAADPAPARPGYDWRALLLKVVPPLVGMALLIAIWGALFGTTETENSLTGP